MGVCMHCRSLPVCHNTDSNRRDRNCDWRDSVGARRSRDEFSMLVEIVEELEDFAQFCIR